jgi:YbgC/YbaW family acyl-CoA thioester hydrolase
MHSPTPLFAHSRPVRFQDVDAAGILFFARAFEYFHDAYLAHLTAEGVDFARVIAERTYGAPLVHAEADYKRPMLFGQNVVVEITEATLGTTSVTVHYRVRAERDPAAVHCTGRTVHAFVDREHFRPRPVPDEVRAALTPKAPTGEAAR